MSPEHENHSDTAESDDVGSAAADYNAEAVVDLRRQRLRPTASRHQVTEQDNHSDTSDEGGEPVFDPYQVGRRNLAGPARPVFPAGGSAPTHVGGVDADPAEWGWRGRVNAIGGLRLRPSRDGVEVAHRRAIERIRQPLPGTPVVLVANPKGGSGVTPATVVLANVFAQHRGGGVVAWDNNESRGTLAARAALGEGEQTVWDVLANARALCSANADASSLARFVRLQPTLDEVLASDQASEHTAVIGAAECAAIMAVLRRHRSMVVIDSGDNDRADSFRWSVQHATGLVVPLVCRRDAVYTALRMLDQVSACGRGDLVAATVVTLAEQRHVRAEARAAVLAALENAGITRVRPVPLDPVLAGGDRIVWSRLHAATTRAWTLVAAAIADGLADALRRAQPPIEAAYLPDTYRTPSSAGRQRQCRHCESPRGERGCSNCARVGVAMPGNRRPYGGRR